MFGCPYLSPVLFWGSEFRGLRLILQGLGDLVKENKVISQVTMMRPLLRALTTPTRTLCAKPPEPLSTFLHYFLRPPIL